jgi:CheY-like chemotaxis protein
MQGDTHQIRIIGRMPMANNRSPRVLIVEDEAMILMLLEDMVCDLGGQIVGPAANFEQAMGLALQAEFDLAVLDVNVNGLAVYPIADVLRYRGIPFVFVTGYESSVVPQRYQHSCVLSKPFSHQTFSNALKEVLASSSGASAAC